ncbi:kinase-like protein [Zalerion maritima]|uniref:Kinase-like protein n=1 Tax=Zalerion maritima TaxID=339359 RepID=A0AAD5WN84_9PEZI|nr:kinase-like protein [Zalerion maritima]
MAAPSPTPTAASQGQPTRRPSTRQGLRRLPSRSRVREESNGRPASRQSSRNGDPNRKAFDPNDSSDDEIPVPMKLSALTKALLNDDVAEAERPVSSHSHRRSLLGGSVNGNGAEKRVVAKRPESVRTTRSASSRQPSRPSSRQSSRPTSPQRSRDNSPVRKRVVRLSATPVGGTRVHRQSISVLGSAPRQQQRPASRSSTITDNKEEEASDVNTPAQGVRQVRIAVGSANRARSTGSSVTGSRKTDPSSNSDYEVGDEPATVNRSQAALNQGSVSRYAASTIGKPRAEEMPHPQSSMRIKRVAKGSFLSGPARRGRRRQSDEEGNSQLEENGERIPSRASHEIDGQHVQESDEVPVPLLSSFYGTSYHDLVVNGSPSSAASRRKASSARASPEVAVEQERSNQVVPEYRLRAPRLEQTLSQDKENNPPPTFKKKASSASLRQEDIKPAKPLNIDLGLPPPKPASPERKPLSTISKNTPRRAAPPPPKMSVLDTAGTTTGAAAVAAAQSRKRNMLKMNSKYYTRIKCLGRGGSAKVYRVTTDNGEMLALKRVSTENADEAQVRGYKGEIDLLRKLSGVNRVINLLDYEMNEEKQLLSLLMEAGDLDFNTILREKHSQEDSKYDPVFVRFYWKEMLECVESIHRYDIVHSDLKPANFVSVHGRLKLIDFGIANAIETDETVNVHRDTQVGTPNYMSPESLIDSNHSGGARAPGKPKLMKLGKLSDVWSLGCILYQMVYGTPPFGHIPNQYARCHAIINWNHPIDFPDIGLGGMKVPHSLIMTLERCLSREAHLRPRCEELLSESNPFLYPVEMSSDASVLPMSEDLLSRIIQSVVMRCKEGMPSDAEVMTVWPQAYWASARKHVGLKDAYGSHKS